MQMLNSLINNISNLFKFNLKSKKHEQNDNLLLFPYIDEETIIKHPLIDEYNLTRLFSVQNYLNKKIHKSKRHIKLKPFYEQSKKLNWIGLVSDIKRPQEPNNTPILLIEKFAEFNDGKASLLDNHVWLNTRYIKAMNSTKQTIAIGEAIQGSSIIGAYTAKNGTEKYGLRETLLKGTGIFVGKDKRNDKITDLNTKFVTDYDRHNDWILKLSQQNSIDYSLCSKGNIIVYLIFLVMSIFVTKIQTRIIIYHDKLLKIHKSIVKKDKRKFLFLLKRLSKKLKIQFWFIVYLLQGTMENLIGTDFLITVKVNIFH